MMTDRQRWAWGHRAGRTAYEKGRDADDNPFMKLSGMPMRRAWLAGWNEAHMEHEQRAVAKAARRN